MRHTLYLLFGLVLLLAACDSNFTVRAPTGLTATPGEGQVTLNWQDKSSNETGFAIYRQAVQQGTSAQQVEDLEPLATYTPESAGQVNLAVLAQDGSELANGAAFYRTVTVEDDTPQ